MHPNDFFKLYDRYYNAMYTTLYTLKGVKPTAPAVDTKLTLFVCKKLR